MQKILLVEDDKRLLDSIDAILYEGLDDIEVISSNDARDGWDKFQNIIPDLIITDNRMPFFSGEKLAKKIRESNASIPIILITGYTDQIEKEIFTEIIYKPFNLKELVSTTRHYLSA